MSNKGKRGYYFLYLVIRKLSRFRSEDLAASLTVIEGATITLIPTQLSVAVARYLVVADVLTKILVIIFIRRKDFGVNLPL